MYIYHARVALRQNQTLKSICHDLINSQTSKLLWCDKRKEEEKLNPWPHTHLVHEEQTQLRDFQVFGQFSPTETLCLAHTPCSACWQTQQRLCDTHCLLKKNKVAATGRPIFPSAGSSTGHVYELGGADGCQPLPSLSSSLSPQVSVSCKQKVSLLIFILSATIQPPPYMCWKGSRQLLYQMRRNFDVSKTHVGKSD